MLACDWLEVSGHYFHNPWSHCFHIGTVISLKWPSDLISVPSCSQDSLPMLASDWPVGFRPLSLQPLVVLLSYWNHELTGNPSDFISIPPAPHLRNFCQGLASDWSCNSQPWSLQPLVVACCFHFGTVNSTRRPSELITVLPCSSHFLPGVGHKFVKRFPTIISIQILLLELSAHLKETSRLD